MVQTLKVVQGCESFMISIPLRTWLIQSYPFSGMVGVLGVQTFVAYKRILLLHITLRAQNLSCSFDEVNTNTALGLLSSSCPRDCSCSEIFRKMCV